MSDAAFATLPDDMKTPSEFYAWRHVIVILGSIYVLLALAYVATAHAGLPWLVLATMPLLGAQIYKITIIMHDACHYSLFRDRVTNTRVGHFASWFVGASFKNFSRLHWQHHARYGEEDDPQGDDYLHLDRTSALALAWHIVRPLCGYNLFKLIQFGRSGGAEAHRKNQAASDRAGVWRERLVFLLGVGAVQLSLAATATGFFSEPWLILLYPASAATFALFFSQTRGFAEHVADPDASPVQHARTHLPNLLDRLFFYTLNFNYHIEHHKYPSVPSCHLPRIHEMMRRDPAYGQSSDSIVGTVLRRWRLAGNRG